ncbi:MAG TPA: hypothetical protein VFG84_06055 [Gemmatimonadaceae bacterium]|nr:hypothetical protein [Gemmatimonadaceae bacterium]
MTARFRHDASSKTAARARRPETTVSAERVLFWISAVVAMAAELFILRSAFLGRSGPARTDASTARRAVEIAWTVLPAVALVVVLLFTWRALQRYEAAMPALADQAPVSLPASS